MNPISVLLLHDNPTFLRSMTIELIVHIILGEEIEHEDEFENLMS
jgi:hypothetical protein